MSPARWSTLAVLTFAALGCKGGDTGPKGPAPASITAQTSLTLTAVVGTVVSPAPSVRVLAADDQPVPNATVTFAVGAGSGTVARTTSKTDADGIASVGQWTLGTSVGQQTLTATVTGLPPVAFTATTRPDVAASIAPNGSPTLSGVVASAVATLPAAVVKDRYGNPVPDVAVTFAVTQGGGSITGANATTDATGVARPASWTLGNTAGANTLTASVEGVATPATFTATAAAGPPVDMAVVAGDGQTATVNSAVAIAPAVRLKDGFGNPVAGYAVTFTATAGSVTDTRPLTGGDGVATPGAWTLGKTVGTNSLTVAAGALSATFTATGLAGPASKLVALATPPNALPVATDVSPKPSVRVTDAYANVIGGATVVFTVVQGSGLVTGGSVTADANGVATVGGWTLGTQAGTQDLRASVGTSATLDFAVNAVAGPPTQMVLVDGANQYGRVGTVLAVSPAVLVLDQYANVAAGSTVTFTPVGVSGTLTGATATASAQGVATVGSWTLGPDEGVDSVYATAGDAPPFPIYARVVPNSQFNITLRYLRPPSASQGEAFQRAAERWRDVVIGDVTDVPISLSPNACGVGEPALNQTVDDLLIYVSIDSIDGPGKVLGSAGPCVIRTSSGLPVVGVMHFDSADLAELEADGLLDGTILHEMGHVLGVGTLWQDFGLLANAGTPDPFFTGSSALTAFTAVGGSIYTGNPVPVENIGGAGTRDGHWRESVFNTELMTGFISPPGVRMPLSLVTVASLEDLGYTITPFGYDIFTLGIDLRRGSALPGRELQDLPLTRAPITVDERGSIMPRPTPVLRASLSARRIELARRAPRQQQSVRRR